MKWFRPITTLLLTIGVTAGFFTDKIDAIAFFGFATGLIVWWFKSRDSDKEKHNEGK